MVDKKITELLIDLHILPKRILCKRNCMLQTGSIGNKATVCKEGYEYLLPDHLDNTEPLFTLLKVGWLEIVE